MEQTTIKTGATSIFIVIFSVLLLTIIGTSFIKIMLDEQQRAINADLNQSAYDSALAGVEDSKRALLKYNKSICKDISSTECKNILDNYLKGQNCDSVHRILGIGEAGKETLIQTRKGVDNSLEQAYTCVKINYDTQDYLRDLDSNETVVVPLRSREDFNQIKFSWHTQKDNGNVPTIKGQGFGSGFRFNRANFADNRIPPVMLLQQIKFNTNLTSYDRESSAIYDNTNLNQDRNFDTLFLRPSNSGASTGSFNHDDKDAIDGKNIISRVKCSNNINADGFYCEQRLILKGTIGSNSGSDYLRITNLLKPTSFRMEFLNNGASVAMLGIQPEIDSNGRANDVYRRVRARVEFMNNNFVYPKGSLTIRDGDFCKKFQVSKTKFIKNLCDWD